MTERKSKLTSQALSLDLLILAPPILVLLGYTLVSQWFAGMFEGAGQALPRFTQLILDAPIPQGLGILSALIYLAAFHKSLPATARKALKVVAIVVAYGGLLFCLDSLFITVYSTTT
jgi:hypothetical protein